MPKNALPSRLLVVGCGNMARAILQGGLDAGVLDAHRIVAVDPAPVKQEAPFLVVSSIEAIDPPPGPDDIVMLAVKPQMLEAGTAPLRPLLPAAGLLVVSILAGASSEKIRAHLSPACRVVRVMPNTPCQVGKGMVSVSLGAGTKEGDDAFALQLFDAIGQALSIPEDRIDSFAAVAGSGPAYIFLLAEAMARGGREMGFDDATAARLARETVVGAAALLDGARDCTATELRETVTSKGGMTHEAIETMRRMGLEDAVIEGMKAARDRGAELAKLP